MLFSVSDGKAGRHDASANNQNAIRLNACHVGRSLSSRVAKVVCVVVDANHDSDSPPLAAMLRKMRFMLACPLLVVGIGFVLLGRIVLTRHDRREFDRHYFGTPDKPQ